MTSRTLRRRVRHGADIDHRAGLAEPLLRNNNNYDRLFDDDDGDDDDRNYNPHSVNDGDDDRTKEELHWSSLFSNLIAQWAQWLANILVGSGSLLGRLLPFHLSTRNGHPDNITPYSITPLQEERLKVLKRRLEVPFNGSCPEHRDALKQLWRLAFPNRDLPSLKSELWKEMGWQGSDPSTDFRGGGFISLENLIYFGKIYPESFHRLLLKQDGNRAEWEYPFAVAGINISFMLAQMLDLQSEKPTTLAGKRFVELLNEDNLAFDNLYCIVFQMMDAQWLAKRASYMEFNDVLKSTRTQLERELSLEDVSSVKDLPAYNMLRA